MKIITLLLMSTIITGSIVTSCKKEPLPPTPIEPIVTSETLSGTISSDVTLTKDKIYYLEGRVMIASGTELTIQAGTIIKGNAGVNTNASSLVIARGAKIHAIGTASEPIIFTSSADNIIQGQIASPNLDPELNSGLWGGIIILGDAPISPASGTTEQIEGIPASVTEGNYEGNNAADNSGEFQYVSIRHGGTVIGSGNEINGLTLGGVGNGTTIDHVEIVGNVDDGIEFFGGTVNASNLVVMYQGDDAFDIDQAYAGTITNIAYIAGGSSDHALEIDGPEGSANSSGAFTIIGGKLQGNVGAYADLRDGARGRVQDLYFFDFVASADLELDDAVSAANYTAGNLVLQNMVFNVDTAVTSLADISDDTGNLPSFDTDFAADNNVLGTTTSVGNTFNKVEFAGWSWADNASLLSNF